MRPDRQNPVGAAQRPHRFHSFKRHPRITFFGHMRPTSAATVSVQKGRYTVIGVTQDVRSRPCSSPPLAQLTARPHGSMRSQQRG